MLHVFYFYLIDIMLETELDKEDRRNGEPDGVGGTGVIRQSAVCDREPWYTR